MGQELTGVPEAPAADGAVGARPSRPRRKAKRSLKTRHELAQLLAYHDITITKLQREGLPIAQRGGRGRPSLYDPDEVRAWLDARTKAATERPAGALNPEQEKARKDRWQAKLSRQRYLVSRGDLVRGSDVVKAWAAEVSAARSKLLAMPAAKAAALTQAAHDGGQGAVERLLREIVREVLLELASGPAQEPPAGDGEAA